MVSGGINAPQLEPMIVGRKVEAPQTPFDPNALTSFADPG
jgi:hypothetical protein